MSKRLFTIAILSALFLSTAQAQLAPTPFSSQGIGKLTNAELIQNSSVGGLGIGYGSYWNLNNLNPAMLTYSRNTLFGTLTVFQAGMIHENVSITDGSSTEISSGSGISYLATGFPIINNKWFGSIGLMPYTNAEFNLAYQSPVNGTDFNVDVVEEGSGGLNSLYTSHGVTITKNISLGVTLEYLFGSRIKDITSTVVLEEIVENPGSGFVQGFSSNNYQRTTVNGAIFKGGIVYTDSIRRGSKPPLRFTLGAVYDFEKSINAKKFESIQRLSTGSRIEAQDADTLSNEIPGKLNMPSGFGVGFSLAQGFKWNVGIDAGIKNYSQFSDFGEELNTTDSYYIRTGAEITPNAFDLDRYLKRVTYRTGLSYEKEPYLINGNEVFDFGINFGVSLPIVPSSAQGSGLNKGFSSVDMSVTYGIQGSTADNLISEEYFRIKFGVTFNDRWFVRRKFN